MRVGRLVDAAVVGYLLGTIPSADLAARAASGGTVDLRTVGSGNPGGTNAMKVLGTKWGLAVMAADVAKGATAGFAGRALAGPNGSHLAATASVVGHCFPVWNGGKGGKGVGTSAGQCLSTFPVYFPVDCAVAAVTVALPWWRRRALAAMVVSSTAWTLSAFVAWRRRWRNAWGPRPTAALPLAAAATSALILYRFTAGAPRPPAAAGPEAAATASATPHAGAAIIDVSEDVP
jgi:acyl phosphate:glycerol-3-phosphate acyltransferase